MNNNKKIVPKQAAPKKIIKKVVLKMDAWAICDDKIQKKAFKALSGISGLESVKVDKKDKKFIVIGDANRLDPSEVEAKLKKVCHVVIDYVGPVEEVKKQPEAGLLKKMILYFL